MFPEELKHNNVVDTIRIQHATASDLDAVALLFNSYRMFYKKQSDLRGARQFLEERITNNESVIFVSFQGDTLTGFAQLYPIFSSTRLKRYWLLNDLFVDENFRGQGISVLLLERVKTWTIESGAGGFMLETAKSNEIGNSLYRKVGMKLDDAYNFYNWEC